MSKPLPEHHPCEQLVVLSINLSLDHDESPDPDSKNNNARYQRHHTQYLQAQLFQPPHSRNAGDGKSQRGPDIGQERAFIG